MTAGLFHNTYLVYSKWLSCCFCECWRCRCRSDQWRCLRASESCWRCRAAAQWAWRQLCSGESRWMEDRWTRWLSVQDRSHLSCRWSCFLPAECWLYVLELQQNEKSKKFILYESTFEVVMWRITVNCGDIFNAVHRLKETCSELKAQSRGVLYHFLIYLYKNMIHVYWKYVCCSHGICVYKTVCIIFIWNWDITQGFCLTENQTNCQTKSRENIHQFDTFLTL